MEAIIIKKLVEPIRKKMPRYGTEKLHLDIKDDLKKNNIKMGRDAFLKFARRHRLLVPRTKRHFITQIQNTFITNPRTVLKILSPLILSRYL